MSEKLIYLDRYRNEGTRTYSRHAEYTEAKPEYRPTSSTDFFTLPSYEVAKGQLLIYTANPPTQLVEKYLPGDHALFCIHPQIAQELTDDPYIRYLQDIAKAGSSINVYPSSSTRTLFSQEALFHALKVHFPFRISRYGRKMRDEVIEQAIRISGELEDGIHRFGKNFAYLREVIGISFPPLFESEGRGENWGYLVRDMRPFPLVDAPREYIPGFALYGVDFFDSKRQPLLNELIDESSPVEFILEKIMQPIIEHWVQCYRSFGYMLEPHGQNVLLEIDSTKDITRIVHRDLSLGIDMPRRRDLSLSSEHLNSYNRMENGEFISITYDMFMGNHFFNRIIQGCRDIFPTVEAEDFQKPCRDYFASIFPEYPKYIPETVYYFGEKRDRYGKPGHLNTGEKPLYRP